MDHQQLETEKNLRNACERYLKDAERSRCAFLNASMIAAIATFAAITGWMAYYLK